VIDRDFTIDVGKYDAKGRPAVIDPDKFIGELIERAPPLTSDGAEQALAAIYESRYRIFNHHDPIARKNRPLAIVALHDAEDRTANSSLYEQLELFVKLDVYKHTGISAVDFFELPREIVQHFFSLARKKVENESKLASELQAGLEGAK
jgi:hypothetical protein